MTSNICKIRNGIKDLSVILNESEKIAEYNGFNAKQALHLRLICEEIDGMLPNIINDYDGDFWIEYNDGVCKVNLSIVIPELNKTKKEELINVAKNKKNAAVVGVVGKIRNSIENFFLNDEHVGVYGPSSEYFDLSTGSYVGLDFSYLWTLNQYKDDVKVSQKEEAWDELEKSIIANLADDIIVGVKGKKANIVIIKNI